MKSNTIKIFLLISIITYSMSFSSKYGIAHQWHSYNRLNKSLFKNNITKINSDYKELFFNAYIDNLNDFDISETNTFSLRYLVKEKYFKGNGPIFFYCGNEGPIEDFAEATGFMNETLAKKYGALVVYGEHRFFGKSFPFSPAQQDFDMRKNKYLTSEQALSDHVRLLREIKENYNIPNAKLITFGGSYGGMLSSWMRMKFPHLVTGAIASSAPILLFEKPSNEFFSVVTNTYKMYENENIKCVDRIKSAFNPLGRVINHLKKNNLTPSEELADFLYKEFKPCQEVKNTSDVEALVAALEDSLVGMAQYNYPYEANGLPGNPVGVICKAVSDFKPSYSEVIEDLKTTFKFLFEEENLDDGELSQSEKEKVRYLVGVSNKLNELYNTKCLDITTIDNQDPKDINGWSYMACSEMIMTMESNNETDMFRKNLFDLDKYTRECESIWKAYTKPKWIYDFYGGRDWDNETFNFSKIVFVNGTMDPWYSGCPKSSKNPEVKILTAVSAHHLDLRTPNDNDPESMVDARKEIDNSINSWLNN